MHDASKLSVGTVPTAGTLGLTSDVEDSQLLSEELHDYAGDRKLNFNDRVRKRDALTGEVDGTSEFVVVRDA